ncbi:MAG: 5'-3' exoribonuclease [Chlamydiae bacterium]|nr:5'-3' exoribonuclease [Chlamydiota bacterium]
MFRADLHTHTTFSDGTCDPKELILLAKEKGLDGLAITDHDNVDAFFEVKTFAKDKLPLLCGIELSCEHVSKSVHVLGYGFDPDIMRDFCVHFLELRMQRNEKICRNLQNAGFKISLDALKGSYKKALGRPQIANYLVETKQISSFQQAFVQYIGNHASCYVEGYRLSIQEAIEKIHLANGKALIAHPHLLKDPILFKELIAMPFDGIEAYYASFTKSQCLPFLEVANQKQWIVTGGSDFHGNIKSNMLGSSFTNEETFSELYV